MIHERKADEYVVHEAADCLGDLARISELMTLGEVEQARALVTEVSQKWPHSPRIQHWARVLAPPVARSVPVANHRSFAPERAWLRAHASEHAGCWLAVLGDQLIAADPDPRQVVARIRQIEGGNNALLHFQPPVAA